MKFDAQDDQQLHDRFHRVVAGAHDWQDEAEMNRLFIQRLSGFARCQLGSRESEWEDALQTSFLHAWEHRSSAPTAPKELRKWLFRISRCVCIDFLRRRRKTETFDEVEPVSSAAGPVTTFRRKETRERVQAVLSRMPAEVATIVRMRLLEETSMQEISELTGRSLADLYRQLKRAERWFRPLETTTRRRKSG